jgi:hypothetical protein
MTKVAEFLADVVAPLALLQAASPAVSSAAAVIAAPLYRGRTLGQLPLRIC